MSVSRAIFQHAAKVSSMLNRMHGWLDSTAIIDNYKQTADRDLSVLQEQVTASVEAEATLSEDDSFAVHLLLLRLKGEPLLLSLANAQLLQGQHRVSFAIARVISNLMPILRMSQPAGLP